MKFTEYINEGTVQDEYKRLSTTIDKNLKQIMINWAKIKSKNEKQFKDDPNSWKGPGGITDLRDVVNTTLQMNRQLNYFKA